MAESEKQVTGGSGFSPFISGALLLLFAGALLFIIFGKVVPPNYIGVRHNYWGLYGLLEEGYGSEGLPPGLHIEIPGLTKVILLPRDFQYLDFSATAALGSSASTPAVVPNSKRELEIPTTDGSKVKTDLSVIVRRFERIGESEASPRLFLKTSPPTAESQPAKPEPAPSPAVTDPKAESEVTSDLPAPSSSAVIVERRQRKHGGPRNLVSSYTTEPSEQLSRFATKAESKLKQTLGELSTTDYYDPEKREERASRANEILNDEVNELGLEVWATLIRRYWYSEQKIDDQIFAKNLQDQTERLFSAQNRLAAAKAATEQERAKWDADIKSLEVRGNSKSEILRSEGTLNESKKRAEGDLAVASARAAVDSAKATALTELHGAEVYVAREMVPLLRSLQGGVVSNIDPYDINGWVERFIPQQREQREKREGSVKP